MTKIFRHSILNALVRNGFFGLVRIGRDIRERRDHDHKAVLHIVKADLCIRLVILAVLLQVGVNRINKCVSHCFFGRTAVFEPA